MNKETTQNIILWTFILIDDFELQNKQVTHKSLEYDKDLSKQANRLI